MGSTPEVIKRERGAQVASCLEAVVSGPQAGTMSHPAGDGVTSSAATEASQSKHPLWEAVKSGDLDRVQCYCDGLNEAELSHAINPGAQTTTPLILAGALGHVPIVSYLLTFPALHLQKVWGMEALTFTAFGAAMYTDRGHTVAMAKAFLEAKNANHRPLCTKRMVVDALIWAIRYVVDAEEEIRANQKANKPLPVNHERSHALLLEIVQCFVAHDSAVLEHQNAAMESVGSWATRLENTPEKAEILDMIAPSYAPHAQRYVGRVINQGVAAAVEIVAELGGTPTADASKGTIAPQVDADIRPAGVSVASSGDHTASAPDPETSPPTEPVCGATPPAALS